MTYGGRWNRFLRACWDDGGIVKMDILRLFFAFSSFVCQLCDCMLLDNFHSLSTWKIHFLSHPHTFARLICFTLSLLVNVRKSIAKENVLPPVEREFSRAVWLKSRENVQVFPLQWEKSNESREREADFPLTDALFQKRINSFPLALSLSHFPLKFWSKNSLCCRIKLIFTSPRSMWCWPERVRRRKDSTFQG